jgi:hypothetical protein
MLTSKSTTEDIKIWLVEVGLDIVCAKFEGMYTFKRHKYHAT